MASERFLERLGLIFFFNVIEKEQIALWGGGDVSSFCA